MDYAVIVLIQVVYGIATLVLISLGLAIIFGMMGVINFAHGEFLMLGGFAFILTARAGVNIWVAMLVVAPLVVGLIGYVIERLIIRRLYGQVIPTILATWGLSLFLIGLAASTLGYFQEGFEAPIGSVTIGAYKESGYTLFVIGVTIFVIAALYLGLRFTRFGLLARGTMQNAEMTAALGARTKRVYAVTFCIGAGLSGLAGAILAPVSVVIPVTGITYIAKAFITVIGGGTTVIAGTGAAAVLFGTVNQAVIFLTNPVLGEVALLVAAVILLRVLPEGITGRFFRSGM